MHRDAEDARPGDARDFAELDEAESAAVVHEGVDGGASQTRFANGRGEVALDHVAGEVVEWIFAIPPSGVARWLRLERGPQRPSAVADDDDRSGRGIDRRCARNLLDRGVVTRDGSRRNQVESVRCGGAADFIERRRHRESYCGNTIAKIAPLPHSPPFSAMP